MAEQQNRDCPECNGLIEFPEVANDRRDFLRVAGGTAAVLGLGGMTVPALARADSPKETPVKTPMPAEALIKELFSGMTEEQRKQSAKEYDHTQAGKGLSRKIMDPNKFLFQPMSKVYTKAQVELLERIVKAMSSGDEGFRRISRGGRWDASGAFTNCGADFFGDPTSGKWAFVFSGHHLTLRCDGDSEEGAAFGGPIYYGHSPDGYSRANIFYYQTQSVMEVFTSLNEKQRKAAVVVKGNPGEHAPSVRLRGKDAPRPGMPISDLTRDQQALVSKVMREILSPFRKEDADEVMAIVEKTGGMEKIQLAFYPEGRTDEKEPWSFWRLEGPGFVWNYRVLPHVHTYVNISTKPS